MTLDETDRVRDVIRKALEENAFQYRIDSSADNAHTFRLLPYPPGRAAPVTICITDPNDGLLPHDEQLAAGAPSVDKAPAREPTSPLLNPYEMGD